MIEFLGRVALAATVCIGAAAPAWGQSAADIINASDSEAIEDQLSGDFGDMARKPSLPLGSIQDAWDEAPDKAGTYIVEWSPDEIIRLRVREKMPTVISFPEWEEIGPVVNGDPFVFDYTQLSPNKLVVEAKYVGADAGFTVLGRLSGNVYAFYLRAESVEALAIPDAVVNVRAPAPAAAVKAAWSPVGARGPGGGAIAEAAAVAAEAASPVAATKAKAGAESAPTGLHDPDYLTAVPFDPTKLQFGFTMSGDKEIAPERVFSDGVFTYFDWGNRWEATDLPAIYRVIDGVDTPQNVRYRGSMIVVEATGAFTLRNGQRVVCVRPDGWEPTQAPTPSAPTPAEPSSGPAAVEAAMPMAPTPAVSR